MSPPAPWLLCCTAISAVSRRYSPLPAVSIPAVVRMRWKPSRFTGPFAAAGWPCADYSGADPGTLEGWTRYHWVPRTNRQT